MNFSQKCQPWYRISHDPPNAPEFQLQQAIQVKITFKFAFDFWKYIHLKIDFFFFCMTWRSLLHFCYSCGIFVSSSCLSCSCMESLCHQTAFDPDERNLAEVYFVFFCSFKMKDFLFTSSLANTTVTCCYRSVFLSSENTSFNQCATGFWLFLVDCLLSFSYVSWHKKYPSKLYISQKMKTQNQPF